jgi:alpha-glucosidase
VTLGLWWRSAVFYEIYVRSFADGDGSGLGDLAGITSRLDHLRDLGVDALWLTPFYPSPQADGGYDVADPRDVDPRFGDLEAFDALVAAAHARELRVVVDIVPNHTSSSHLWFVEALAGGPGSPARDRYLFRDGRGPGGGQPPNNWQSVFGGPAWTRVPDGQWYLHLFAPEQPDLNWRHPDVPADYERTLRFWLDRGVDGFRIDVAHGLLKHAELPDTSVEPDLMADISGDLPMWNQPDVHEVYRSWRAILDSYPGDRMAVGEVWLGDPRQLATYVRPDELPQAFNFRLLQAPWKASAWRGAIDKSLVELTKVGADATWVLSNHDVVRHVTRYGGGAVGLARAKAALLTMLALPGAVYLYQGEELGLEQVDLPDAVLVDPTWERSGHTDRGRDGCRVPIPWSGSLPPFGFTSAMAGWLPMPYGWDRLTVEAQTGSPGSTLELYRTALTVRRSTAELHRGELVWYDAGPDVISFGRRTPEGELLCLLNQGSVAVPAPVGELLLGSGGEAAVGLVAPDGAVWVRRP